MCLGILDLPIMPDAFSSSQRHHIMASIHSASTKPEVLLRHSLWHIGFRYCINDRHLPGTPDIVLPKYRTAIFVHGCFWHGHKDCKYYSIPKSNTDFWISKVSRNQERDQEVWRQLEAKGWAVIIVWECQLKKLVINETISRVVEEIHRNGESFRKTQEERKASREAYRKEMKYRREREAALKAELKAETGE